MLRSRIKNNFNKQSLMKTETIIRSKEIFVLDYSTRPLIWRNETSISKDSSWTGNEASITKWRFKYDTKLAMRSNVFSLLLALEQISEICSWKWSSELVKTPSSVSFVLDLIEEPPKCDSVVFLNFTRDAIFQDCFSHGYFWTKWKAHEMWNVIFYIPNIPSMKESVTFTVIFAISKSESFIENKKIKTF